MKKVKKFLALTFGFVGSLLAGVFALQTPAKSPVTVSADNASARNISYVLVNNSVAPTADTPLKTCTVFWVDGGTDPDRELHLANGTTSQDNEALANFAKQVKVIKADSTVTSMYDYGTLEVIGVENLQWNGLSVGDEVIIPQGTTFKNDVDGDGIYEINWSFKYTFKLIVGGTCAEHDCVGQDVIGDSGREGTCIENAFHSIHWKQCTTETISQVNMQMFTQEDHQLYLLLNGATLTLNTTDGDNNNEQLANWTKQMYFATSPDGINFTYYNYYEYAKEKVGYGVCGQGSQNILFTGFANDWDTLIIPQGTTLSLDTDGDYATDYHWVAGKTFTIIRWKGTVTPGIQFDPTSGGTYKYNCPEFESTTGYACDGQSTTNVSTGTTTADGVCSGYFHQIATTASNVDVTTVTSAACLERDASLFINNQTLERLPASYAYDASTWTYNGEVFTDVCYVNIVNGYINFTNKQRAFYDRDVISIPAGTVITNTITGTTYTFANTTNIYYLSGKWYSAEAYYEIGQTYHLVSQNSNKEFFIYFQDVNGGTVSNGYTMTGGDAGSTNGWHAEDANHVAFKSQITVSVAYDALQIPGQPDALWLYSDTGALGSGVVITIPQGTVYYANKCNDTGVSTQVLWYFPHTIELTIGGAQVLAATLPVAPETTNNNVFVGYKLISKTDSSVLPTLYQPGYAYDPLTYTYEAVTLEMYMEKGASARLSEVDSINGIRYTVNVNKAQLQSIKDTFGVTLNLGLRVRVVNAQDQISKTESTFNAITDVLGTSQTGNVRESGNYLVYSVTYVMHQNFIDTEILKDYRWLGDGFVEIVASDLSTMKVYAVQNDNARSYRYLIDYYLNQSWTTEATETNVYKITHTLSDGETKQDRYYSFYYLTYKVLLAEAERASVEVKDNQ